MKRFTERDEFGNADIIGVSSCDLGGNLSFEELNRLTKALNRLAELEDKLESGQLIELPCKVGDTMYGISSPLHIVKAKLSKICYEVVTRDGHHLIGHLGISLFIDEAEAEARLKELQEGI